MSTKLYREWICDRCGRQQRSANGHTASQPPDWADIEVNAHVADVEDDTFHLCPKCHRRLRKWMGWAK